MHQITNTFIGTQGAGRAWHRRQPVPADNQILRHTLKWLKELPKGVRPVHLPTEFPRIANDVARLWLETAALDRYFEDKEFSPRDDRTGFTPIIKEELLAMHLYSIRTRPARRTARAPQQRRLFD